uniref:SpoVT-AbrB domain-containing protein n=1 Tax=Steinernema glaseri TaxID=37863 RepID=A0A1I8AQ85_9BILA
MTFQSYGDFSSIPRFSVGKCFYHFASLYQSWDRVGSRTGYRVGSSGSGRIRIRVPETFRIRVRDIDLIESVEEFFTPLSDTQSAIEDQKPIEIEISKYLSENRLKEPTFANENSKEVLMY